MINLKQLDEITFLANIAGKYLIVFEFENDFALQLHIMEIKLKNKISI